MNELEETHVETLEKRPSRMPGRTAAVAVEGLIVAVLYAAYSPTAGGIDITQVILLLVIGFVLLNLGGLFRIRVSTHPARSSLAS